ncbi:hypothetical protein R3P38DRAFT_2765928 [Favolaschia claudopus]|uniref:Uncharacterized protein n=1 Tax=Favolaschia claudopus TaxID=2862362 RepID=A0AAW0D6U2_9AGAR
MLGGIVRAWGRERGEGSRDVSGVGYGYGYGLFFAGAGYGRLGRNHHERRGVAREDDVGVCRTQGGMSGGVELASRSSIPPASVSARSTPNRPDGKDLTAKGFAKCVGGLQGAKVQTGDNVERREDAVPVHYIQLSMRAHRRRCGDATERVDLKHLLLILGWKAVHEGGSESISLQSSGNEVG